MLTIFGIVAKIVGAVYRIPLTNILGAEGIGIYQLVFSIYALLLAFTSAFVPTLLSKQIAEQKSLGRMDYAYAYFRHTLLVTVITSAVIAVALSFGCRAVASAQGNSDAYLGYAVIAPAIVLVALLSCFKGWFNGNMNLFPTAISIVLEQLVKLGAGLTLTVIFVKRGIAYGAAAALLGVTLAEVAALVFMVITFYFTKEKQVTRKIAISGIKIFKQAAPLTIGSVIMPMAAFLDSLLIVNLLMRGGELRSDALSQYGILTGAVYSVVNMPVIITLSIAVALIPVIARSKSNRDIFGIKQNGAFTLKLALVIALPCSLGLIALAPQIISILYPVLTAAQIKQAATLLAISSAGIIFLAITQIYSSLLQALDGAETAAINLLVSVTLRLGLMLLLIPRAGIYGAAVAGSLCYVISAALNSLSWIKLTGGNTNNVKKVVRVVSAGAIMLITVLALSAIIANNWIAITISVLFGGFAYLLMVLRFKVFTREELLLMPLSFITLRLSGDNH